MVYGTEVIFKNAKKKKGVNCMGKSGFLPSVFEDLKNR